MFEMISKAELAELTKRIDKLEENVIILAENLLTVIEYKTVERDDNLFTSKIYYKTNKTISSSWRAKESRGTGVIDQILLKTLSNDFHVYFLLDDDVNYDHDYDFLYNNSQELHSVSAYKEGDYYVLSLRNMAFQKKFSLRLTPLAGEMTFSIVLIRYNIRNEVFISE